MSSDRQPYEPPTLTPAGQAAPVARPHDRRIEVYDGERLITVFTLPETTDWVTVKWREPTAAWQSEVALEWDE
jgi:hypothetical protein